MDDYCPQCWKKGEYVDFFSCSIHSKYLNKEHIQVDGKAACGQAGNVILFEKGCDIDSDLVCNKCKKTSHWRGHLIELDLSDGFQGW